MVHKKARRATFVEIVSEVPEPPPPVPQLYSYTIPMLCITGDDGARWHLRGDGFLEGRQLHKALSGDLPVVHIYMGERKAVSSDEREAFWQRAVAAMAQSAFSDFRGYEYKNDEHGRCLVVYEFC